MPPQPLRHDWWGLLLAVSLLVLGLALQPVAPRPATLLLALAVAVALGYKLTTPEDEAVQGWTYPASVDR